MVGVQEEIDRVVPFVSQVRAAHPGRDHQRRHLAQLGGRGRVRSGRRPDQRHLGGRRPRPRRGGRAVRRRHRLLAHRRRGASDQSAPGRLPGRGPSVIDETTTAAAAMVAAGVPRAGILIDPTHDFGKNTWHGLELLRPNRRTRRHGLAGADGAVQQGLRRRDLGVVRARAAGGHPGRDCGRRAGRRSGVPRAPGASRPAAFWRWSPRSGAPGRLRAPPRTGP